MKLQALLLAFCLIAAGDVLAEGGCPHGQTPAQFGATMGCIPGGNDSPVEEQHQQQAAARPAGYWEKTWGAIAPSPKGGKLGTALGANSKQEAERRALADCKAKGGQSCKVELAYHNQCAVMVLGDNKYGLARAASIAEASEDGLKLCRERGDTNCEVYYSACTDPIFRHY